MRTRRCGICRATGHNRRFHNPLTKKGRSILRSMRKTYKERAKSVFYASAQSGRIKGVES